MYLFIFFYIYLLTFSFLEKSNMVARNSNDSFAVQRVPEIPLGHDAPQVPMGPFGQRFADATSGIPFRVADLVRIGQIGDRITSLETGGYNEALIGQLEDDITWLNGGTINNRDNIIPVLRDAVNTYRANRLVAAYVA